MTKMPAPTIAPMPRKMRCQGPSTRLRPWAVSSASRDKSARLFLARSRLLIGSPSFRAALFIGDDARSEVGRQRRLVLAALLVGLPLVPHLLDRLGPGEKVEAGRRHDLGGGDESLVADGHARAGHRRPVVAGNAER